MTDSRTSSFLFALSLSLLSQPSFIDNRRAHTNGTTSISSDGKTATIELNGKTLLAELRSPSDATFGTAAAERTSTLPALQGQAVDQPNPGVTVLVIDIPAPTSGAVIEVVFNPQWKGKLLLLSLSRKYLS